MLSHGGTPSENIVGDLQTFSNLEAGLLYGFNEVFYQYARDDFWLKIGQVDINTDFMFSSNGLLFAHSSFGIDPVLTINLPAPTYPVTGFSITSQIPINDQLKVRLGAFDGQFGMPENNYLGLDWSISRDEGLLLLSEFEIDLFQNDLNQKFGVYHHSGQFYNYVEEENSRGQTAFYYIADWKAFQWNGTTANFFVQFDKAQRSNSQILYYFGGGIKLERYSTNNKKRELGLAFGHAEVNEVDEVILQNYNLKGETVFEASFKFELNPKFSLQPYIQWINIESLNQEDRNPFILAFRAHINL